MSEKKESPKPNLVQPQSIRRTAHYIDIYANQTLLSFSGTDVQVLLGTGTFDNGTAITDQHATLFLAPAQAKYLGMALLKSVAAYERTSGSMVTLPDQLIESLKFYD